MMKRGSPTGKDSEEEITQRNLWDELPLDPWFFIESLLSHDIDL